MKYYINRNTGNLLKDINDSTSYLKDRGYIEITEQEYKVEEQKYILAHQNDD